MDLTTGRPIALETVDAGCVAIAADVNLLDAEATLVSLAARETGRDAHAHTVLPASPPPSAWAFMTRG